MAVTVIRVTLLATLAEYEVVVESNVPMLMPLRVRELSEASLDFTMGTAGAARVTVTA